VNESELAVDSGTGAELQADLKCSLSTGRISPEQSPRVRKWMVSTFYADLDGIWHPEIENLNFFTLKQVPAGGSA
tara:strand:+ start:9220 stop:9444 length:225 start_codon:yes stop_codon:yes gene_type:complete